MDTQQVKISVRNLVEFIFRGGDLDNRRSSKADMEAMQKGSRLHRKIQSGMKGDYRAELSLVHEEVCDGYTIRLEGRADGLFHKDDLAVIDEIKGVYFDIQSMEEPVYVHQAQAMCYAYIYGKQNGQEEMGIQMTYGHLESEDIRRFFITFTMEELAGWFGKLMAAYEKWMDYQFTWRQERNESMTSLKFPFPYREGQKELVSGVYRTIVQQKQLFIQAPTGVGKTMSTLYPSVRAVGEGLAEKIFYLTAKTITRTVAEEAYSILKGQGLKYKTVTITAREKICPQEVVECNPDSCPYAKGHFDRVNDAVYELWTSADTYDRANLLAHAAKWQVCPFELCLDLALWVDGVICDYNYVFDPNAHLQRFFGDSVKGEYIFLIDEAHNLVERGREMFSATLYKEDVLEAKRQMKEYSKEITRSLEKVNRILLEYKRECTAYQVLENAGSLPVTVMNAQTVMEKYMEEHPQFVWKEESLELYFALRMFNHIYELVDENYEIYTEMEPSGRFKFKLFCVNPAANLQDTLDKGVASIFFSATLLPVDYYSSLLSMRQDDYAMYARSPFDEANRKVLVCREVSSKYTRRGYEEYRKIAAYIYHTIRCRTGNYMVFFPSYKLLEDVAQIFQEEFSDEEEYPGFVMDREGQSLSPGEKNGQRIRCIRQTPGMHEGMREEFLEAFREEREDTLVGFCVMGGIFSEGIDLIGESLIGALIVGTGIPQVSYEREILKNHYDKQGRKGFDYAYRFPGMNKVLQSAGRVIRTATDRGVILLLDERFLQGEYLRLFPREWRDYERCSLENVEKQLQDFWKSR